MCSFIFWTELIALLAAVLAAVFTVFFVLSAFFFLAAQCAAGQRARVSTVEIALRAALLA
jgi:hypothetical protein